MFALKSRAAMVHQRRSVLALLLAFAVTLSLAACDGADDLLAPATDPAPSEALSSGAVLTLTTGQRIAFLSYRNGHPDIYKMDPQGNNIAPLTNSADYKEEPAWSYDNKHIALVRLRVNGNAAGLDIYMIDANGSNGHWVRPTPFPYPLQEPSWSPDGSRLVLTVGIGGISYIGWMDVATGQVGLFNAISGGVMGWRPSYDATGHRIIYVGKDSKTIEQINPDGTGHKVRISSATPLRDPAFSPDGKKIAFSRLVGTGNNYELFVKNYLDGSMKRLTTSSAYDMGPTWSPDGSKIAFASRPTAGKFQVYTIGSTGGPSTRITHTSVEEGSPAWSH
ncbi:MAG TPA: hypothetical protein VGJ36_04495 [Gemmatimonadales bacterium]|jgi:Tol biopolymer transport system component